MPGMRPHIILINPDQWRWDAVGHLGNPAAHTPVLDAWVRNDAVSFRRAFCQNPVCTPSRCSFMTGWYPHVRGHRTMFHMLRPDEPCLLRTLKDNGYHVWWGGKNDLVPAQNGFDDYCDVRFQPSAPRPGRGKNPGTRGNGDIESDGYYSFHIGELSTGDDGIRLDADWLNVFGAIEQIRNAPPDKPLCIFLPLVFPHPPYGVEKPWFSAIDREALLPRIPAPASWDGKPSLLAGIHARQHLGGWTEDRWTELRATYLGMCARVDHQFGLILDALREAGLHDEAAVFLFSDHGDFTGDYGLVEKTQNTFEDCLTRVPLLVKPPRDVAVKPRVTDAMVELIDIIATVEDLTGITPGYTHFGRSLLPIIAGDTDLGRDAVFCEGGRLAGEDHAKELESAGSHDPARLYWPRLSLQAESDVAHTRAVMCRTGDYKYVRRLYENDELYDLNADPAELCNLIDDPACAAIAVQLRDRMLTHFLETADVVPWRVDQRN